LFEFSLLRLAINKHFFKFPIGKPRNDEDPAGLESFFKLPESSSLRGRHLKPKSFWEMQAEAI